MNNAPALLLRRIGTKRPVGLAFTTVDGRAEPNSAWREVSGGRRRRPQSLVMPCDAGTSVRHKPGSP